MTAGKRPKTAVSAADEQRTSELGVQLLLATAATRLLMSASVMLAPVGVHAALLANWQNAGLQLLALLQPAKDCSRRLAELEEPEAEVPK